MGVLFVMFFFLIAIASIAITIWSVVEIATKPFKKESDKVIWLIVVLLLGGIGPLIYLSQRKNLLANPPGGNQFDDREYLPPLDDHLARPQVQKRYDEQDDYV
ncbi:PLDc_N domain-containing protein [Neolewinella aurantiaca]|uniref:PLDc_N domain-containing protein n=1 Tax=Neolewinella aurantiaca TaxID=2602767 RepID=A0A5C7FVR7_9BACT|nr:PLDc N-terminal domain-containing protein [Neolewinella aurantiaca]TXF89687.1 PLDc_N domain-containing protein [Neolewinella aurantiaca]